MYMCKQEYILDVHFVGDANYYMYNACVSIRERPYIRNVSNLRNHDNRVSELRNHHGFPNEETFRIIWLFPN
jgi:hypothetical protein